MAKIHTGFDIGGNMLKIAVCSDAQVKQLVAEPLPDSLVKDGRIVSSEAMSEFLKETAKRRRVTGKDCAVVIPASQVFIRRITMPLMTVDQLKLNLPYEFRDYITREKDKYFYDYSVIRIKEPDQEDPQGEMELLAVATEKSTIDEYREMFRRAGFRMKIAAPQECAFTNLLQRLPVVLDEAGRAKDYCIVDAGHDATRVHIYSAGAFEVSKIIDYGGFTVDSLISEIYSVDEHVARTYKESNYKNVLDEVRCANLFSTIAVEIMKTINFYGFNNPVNNLDSIYMSGGGSRMKGLLQNIENFTGFTLRSVEELLPPVEEGAGDGILAAAAVGIALG